MRIAICDDQAEYRHQAEAAIRECMRGTDILTDTYSDPGAFLRAFIKKPYDLVFLDIEMPDVNGIQLAKMLRSKSKDVPIVFLTSHIEFALEGYEVNALRYLTKPISIPKLQEVLTYVSQKLSEQRVLWIKTDLTEEKLHMKDILYMEAQNQNILIYTSNGTYSVRYNLSDYEQELKNDGFFRIHRGYLVSVRHVKRIGKHELTLVDNTTLPVSRSKEKALKEVLFQFIREEAI